MRYMHRFVAKAACGAFIGDRIQRHVANKKKDSVKEYRHTALTMREKEYIPGLVFIGVGLGLCVTSLVATHHILFPMLVGDWVYASAKTAVSSFSPPAVK